MMNGQARRSGLVMGLDTHMIAGSRAASPSHPAVSPDHHQLDNPALCRGPERRGETGVRMALENAWLCGDRPYNFAVYGHA